MEVNSKARTSNDFSSVERAVSIRQMGGCLGPIVGLYVRRRRRENLLQLLKIVKFFSVFQPVLKTQQFPAPVNRYGGLLTLFYFD